MKKSVSPGGRLLPLPGELVVKMCSGVGLGEVLAGSRRISHLPARVKFSRVDLVHNAWLTAGRTTWKVRPKTFEQLRCMTLGQQAEWRERQKKQIGRNRSAESPCIFCGSESEMVRKLQRVGAVTRCAVCAVCAM